MTEASGLGPRKVDSGSTAADPGTSARPDRHAEHGPALDDRAADAAPTEDRQWRAEGETRAGTRDEQQHGTATDDRRGATRLAGPPATLLRESPSEPVPTPAHRLGAIARQRRRVALLSAAALLLLAALMLAGICLGHNTIAPDRALSALFFGTGDRGDVLLVGRFRTPRVLSAVIAGAGLAVAGAVLQRVARNPLASPDVVGITGGASLGATAAVAFGLAAPFTPLAALGGGLCAAAIFGLLAWKGGISPTRLVLVGLAVQAGLTAAVNLFIVRFPAELASSALHWTTGSLYGRNWNEAIIGAAATTVALAAAFALDRRAAVLDLGDDAAGALGARPGAARLQLLTVAVVLASLAVALTGPVGFVALAVPHLVRRLAGPPTAGTLALNALAGALLLLAADLIAQHALPLDGLPVGVVTSTLGAPFLLALLARQNRPDPRSAR